jgi:hypothetical protein
MMDEKKALAKSESKTIKARETFDNLDRLADAMLRATEKANIIAPIVAFDHIPVFHEVSLRLRVVRIDGREMKNGGEVYKVQGGLALGKSALAKLSIAARITWDAIRSGRLDDSSDAHYCHFRAVGFWPDFDGSRLLEISGEKVLDLREGSALCQKLEAEAERSAKKYNKPSDGGEARIREMRSFIIEHSESKARNRAIRQALALKSKYSAEELKRPFVVPTLIETGRCDDPELKKEYYRAKLAGQGLATKALYNGGEPPVKPGDMEVLEVEAKPINEEPKQPPPPVEKSPEYIDEETGEVHSIDDNGDHPF